MFREKSDRQIALQTHSEISTKFALQTRQNYRQIYRQNSHDEVDKVHPANATLSTTHGYCAIATVYCAIGKLETFSPSNFTFPIPKDYKPLKY